MNASIIICGPTCTGKTGVAIQLAQEQNAHIISCDSMQIYKKLSIGTAKPSADERHLVPHHLVDFIEPSENYSVAQYLEDAHKCMSDLDEQQITYLFAGGTGLYIKALIDGVTFASSEASTTLRESIQQEYLAPNGPQKLLQEIHDNNPSHASKLSLNDQLRIVRAVELIRTTGHSYSYSSANQKDNSSFCCFFLNFADRSVLYDKIHLRVDKMMESGLLEEAELVYKNRASYPTASNAIGYKEFFPYFENHLPLSDCIDALKQATRNYAKRQITFFRHQIPCEEILIDGLSVHDIANQIKEKWISLEN